MKNILKFLCLLSVVIWNTEVCIAQKLSKTFSEISQLGGFQELSYTAEEYGFPKEMGEMKMVCYGNAEPRDKVLEILATIPQSLLKIDDWDEKEYIRRYYLEKDNNGIAFQMQTFIGHGGNDLCVVIHRSIL